MATIHLAVSILLFAIGAWLLIASTVGTGGLAPGLDRCLQPPHCNDEYTTGLTVKLLIGIGLISCGVIVAKAASKPTQEKLSSVPVDGVEWLSGDKSESLKEYEDEYLARQGIESTSRKPTARRKPAETRESESNFCDNCGKSLRPTAKFCSGCGTPRS